jgi:hypothetical protein
MGALDDVRAKFQAGSARPEDLALLFKAIEELASRDPDVQAELSGVKDVTVNFVVEKTDLKTYLKIANHRLQFGVGTAPNPDVTLSVSAEVAGYLAAANMDKVREAVFAGGFNVVSGDINKSMALLPIFEMVVERLQA